MGQVYVPSFHNPEHPDVIVLFLFLLSFPANTLCVLSPNIAKASGPGLVNFFSDEGLPARSAYIRSSLTSQPSEGVSLLYLQGPKSPMCNHLPIHSLEFDELCP